MPRLLILGAGGFAAAVAETALATGQYQPVGFLDDRYPEISTLLGLPVLGRLDHPGTWRDMADCAVTAFGSPVLRRRGAELIGAQGLAWCTLVHPRAIVSPSATLGKGVIVLQGAIVGTRCDVGDGALLNAGVVLDHDVRIGEFAHLAVASCVGGGGRVAPDATLDAGQAVATGGRHPRDAGGPPAA